MSISSPTRIGLIGCGGIVQKTHLPCLLRLKDHARVVALADPVAASRELAGEAAGIAPAHRYEDFPALLRAGGLDLVLIATPHHLHLPAVTAAAAHGLAVICEKPLGPHLDDSRRLVGTLQKSGTSFSVVHNFLFSPGNLRAQELLRRGGSEKPCFGRGQSLFAKEAPLNPQDWRNRVDTGGGALNDTCYHEIYQMEMLVGAPVVCVQARVRTVLHAITADDLVLLTLEHANGVLSTVATAWAVPAFEGSFCEVHTDLRTLRVEGRGRQLRLYDRATRRWQPEPLGPTEAPGIASGHFGFWQETLRAFRHGEALPVPPLQALRQVELLDAARQSSLSRGQPVEVELTTQNTILS